MYRHQLPIVLTGSISRASSFINKFYAFAKWMCDKQRIIYNAVECLRDNELAEMFISEILAEDKGKTRPGSARTAINLVRKLHNIPVLPVGGVITKTCSSAMRSAATTVKQTLSIHVDNIRTISSALTNHPFWFFRQIALLTVTGFVLLLRFGEARALLKMGIRIILTDLHELTPCYISATGDHIILSSLPCLKNIRAVQFCLTSRKTAKTHSSWVTASDRTLCRLLLEHLISLRSMNHKGKFLFPSRTRQGGSWIPNPTNPIRSLTYVRCIRKALHEICGFPWDVCMGYTGHLLRVGGNNFILQSKQLSEDINRQLGGWASLPSCRDYNQLLLQDKLTITDKISL